MDTILKNQLLSVKIEDTENNIRQIKDQQIQEIYQKFTSDQINEYEQMVFKGVFEDIKLIQLVLEFVENDIQELLFEYYCNVVSSIPQYNVPGRQVKILVKDGITNKYLGLLQLTVDLLVNENKNNFLKIQQNDYGKYKKIIRDCGVNISICVPLQPFGYNFCGGKLLAMIAFSKEIYDYYYNKYHIKIAYIITTSIHGKSIQYSKLKCLKYIGLTEGYGTGHISENIVNDCKLFVEKRFPKYNIKKMSKHTILNLVIKTLQLNPDILQHNQRRGIYIGLTGIRSCEYIKDKLKDEKWKPDLLQPIENIFDEWIEKYCCKRYTNLIETGRFNSS